MPSAGYHIPPGLAAANALKALRDYRDPARVTGILEDIKAGRLRAADEKVCAALAPLAAGRVGGSQNLDDCENCVVAQALLCNYGQVGVDAVAQIFLTTEPRDVGEVLCQAMHKTLRANPGMVDAGLKDRLLIKFGILDQHDEAEVADFKSELIRLLRG